MALPEISQDVDRLGPLACQGKKTLYPKQVSMNKRKLGGIRLIPEKNALSIFIFLALFGGPKAGFEREPATPNRRTSCQTNEYCTWIGPRT
jgi:hypothetical protein